jgi:hypothetical protein
VQDGIFTFNVYRHHEKPWVEQLMIPYLVFFGVACVVSLFTLGQKGKLLVDKFRQRHAAASNADESVETPEEKLIANRMEIRKIYCVLLLGATEGAHCGLSNARLAADVGESASGCAARPVHRATFCRAVSPWLTLVRAHLLLSLCFRSADVCTLALLPCSVCRRVHPFGRCPSHAFE